MAKVARVKAKVAVNRVQVVQVEQAAQAVRHVPAAANLRVHQSQLARVVVQYPPVRSIVLVGVVVNGYCH